MGRSRRRAAFLAAVLVVTSIGSGAVAAEPSDVQAAEEAVPIYLDTAYSAEERAADLVSRMTLAEKASQMNSSMAAAIPRLGVERYAWWNEALHGVAREGRNNNQNPAIIWNTTSYPMPLSVAATWNPELQHREAQMISDEAREVFRDNRFNLNFYSPTVNLARDPRWGRNDEAFSEDPLLTAAMGGAFVTGMEGKDLDGQLLPEAEGYLKTTTTIKHYTANNSEFDRRTGTANMDDRTLREYYTAPYRKIVDSADVASIMTSYGRVNGTPATANVYLLDTLARQTFGFGGFFTADCDSIYEMQRGHRWVPPGSTLPVDRFTRHAFALGAGLDLDCNRGYADQWNYGNMLPLVVAQGHVTPTGIVTENAMDVSLVRLFTARMLLGEFDDPELVSWVREARERVPRGTWTDGANNGAITMTPERLSMAREVAAQGLVLLKNDERDGGSPLLPLDVPEEGEFRVAVFGQYANPAQMYLGGYSSNQGPSGRAHHVNGYQGIKAAVEAINSDAQVDHFDGFTRTQTGGTPSRPIYTYHLDMGAIQLASQYDVVVVYVGTDASIADEDRDRANLRLPGVQQELIEEVAVRNPDTVVYIEAIGHVEVEDFKDDVPAMLFSSYNGQRKGEALSDVLLGQHNPSGHLPFTWYQSVSQLPPINDYHLRPTESSPGRTYMYFDGDVTYPFGHGLSYSDFAYSNVRVDKTTAHPKDSVTVRATVRNDGELAGAEVVQLYVATPDAEPSLERPHKRLAAFERVMLEPGEARDVAFTVDIAELAFYNEEEQRFDVDTGRYEWQVSTSATEIAGTASTRVSKSLSPREAALRTLDPKPAIVTVKANTEADASADVPERVYYEVGDTIVPKVTVAMDDDRLYGYIHKGKSVPLPDNVRISFRSNRPSIVSTSGGGQQLSAKQPGVATITASARVLDQVWTTSFVVYIVEPEVPADDG
jgi:beta-glucosidase